MLSPRVPTRNASFYLYQYLRRALLSSSVPARNTSFPTYTKIRQFPLSSSVPTRDVSGHLYGSLLQQRFHLTYPCGLLQIGGFKSEYEALFHLTYPCGLLPIVPRGQWDGYLLSSHVPVRVASAKFTKTAPLRLCNFAQIRELSSVFVAHIVGLTRTFSTLGREIALCFGANLI